MRAQLKKKKKKKTPASDVKRNLRIQTAPK